MLPILIVLALVAIYFYTQKTPEPVAPVSPVVKTVAPFTVKHETFEPALRVNYTGVARPLEGPKVGMHQMHHKMDDMRVESRYKPKTSDETLYGFISPVVGSTPKDIRGPLDD